MRDDRLKCYAGRLRVSQAKLRPFFLAWPGMARVIVPERNMRDVGAELPPSVRGALEIIPATRLEQVLAAAFDPPLLLLPQSRL